MEERLRSTSTVIPSPSPVADVPSTLRREAAVCSVNKIAYGHNEIRLQHIGFFYSLTEYTRAFAAGTVRDDNKGEFAIVGKEFFMSPWLFARW